MRSLHSRVTLTTGIYSAHNTNMRVLLSAVWLLLGLVCSGQGALRCPSGEHIVWLDAVLAPERIVALAVRCSNNLATPAVGGMANNAKSSPHLLQKSMPP